MKRHNQGFSILGALVAAAILAIVGLGFSKMLVSSKSAQTGISNSVDFDILKTTITQIIDNPAKCSTGLRKSDGTIAKYSEVAIPAADQVASIGFGASAIVAEGDILGGGLEITAVRLERDSTAVAPPDVVTIPGKIIYEVMLNIDARKNTSGIGGSVLSTSKLPWRFSIVVDAATNDIESCGGGVGGVARFHDVCATGAGAGNGNLCCRVDNNTGIVTCRWHILQNSPWNTVTSPFPADVGPGDYLLTLIGFGVTNYGLCRTERKTGAMDFMEGDNPPNNPVWTATMPEPF